MENTNNRLDYIDIAKAVGMFAIIWGHILLHGWSNLFVYSFHIPLFFFLSGMVFNGAKYDSLWQLVKRRAKTLLLPYLLFSVLTWIIWVGTKIVSHEQVNLFFPLLETVFAQGSVGYVVHNLPLWFVPCLFVVEIVYYFMNKLSEWLVLICCVCCALIGNYMIRGGHLDFFSQLPWSIEGAMNAIFYYALGNILIKHVPHHKLVDKISSYKVLSIISIIVLTIILLYSSIHNGAISVGSNELGNNTVLYYINALIGITTTLAFCILLSQIRTKTAMGNSVLNYIRWFGRNSFYVMATHFPVKEAFIRLLGFVLHTNREAVVSNMKYSLIVFILTLLVDSVVVLVVCKLKEKDLQRIVKKNNG